MQMNEKVQRRLILVIIQGVVFLTGFYLVCSSLKQNLNIYIEPSQVTSEILNSNAVVRIGGLVKAKSLTNNADQTQFTITDLKNCIHVKFSGVLPGLFKEGQGAIVEGKFSSANEFVATNVLAKHDENYKPPSSV